MVYYHLIKFGIFKGSDEKEVKKLLGIAESDFGARIYPIPDKLKDEVEEKTLSAAYRGDRLVLAQFPSEEKQKVFVVFTGNYLFEHRTISNFGFPPISNNDFVEKIVVESVKKDLLDCSGLPVRGRPDPCIKAGKLNRILETVRGLNSGSLKEIFEHAKNLNLPPDFQEELKFEYEKRGFKS